MDLRDRDLISVQEARDLVAHAAAAQKKFAAFSQQQIDAMVESCAAACAAAAEPLARRAVEETGFGNVPDKTTKNRLASVDVPRAMAGMRTIGVIGEDREKGIVEVGCPVGVVAAVIPSTNPTSTAIYNTLIALKSGNAIVLSPHPSAIRAICETAGVLRRAALSAGCPEGLIGCMQHTTLAGTRELMSHRDVGVILATGGTGLVRAAYGSGKPAYGVGPGNVPAFIERTADVRKAIGDIFAGKTFDYGTICSSEQAIVVEEAVRDAALEECRKQGAHLLSSEEAQAVGGLVFLPGTRTPNTDVVGRPATVIAEMAGIRVPRSTRVLIARLAPEQVGRAFPLSAEKLSPILAFYAVANLAAGIELCQRLLGFGGLGHTCAIHSENDAAIRQFGRGGAGISRVREHLGGTRLDRLLDESVSGDDAGVRRARRQHHVGQHWSATPDEREAHCLGVAARGASQRSGGATHGEYSSCGGAVGCGCGGRSFARRGAVAGGARCRTRCCFRSRSPRSSDRGAARCSGCCFGRIRPCADRAAGRASALAIQHRARERRCGRERLRARRLIAASRVGSASALAAEISQTIALGDRGGTCQSSVWLRCGRRRNLCSCASCRCRWLRSGPGAHPRDVCRNAAIDATEGRDFPVRQRERCATRVDASGENLYRAEDHRDSVGARPGHGP